LLGTLAIAFVAGFLFMAAVSADDDKRHRARKVLRTGSHSDSGGRGRYTVHRVSNLLRTFNVLLAPSIRSK